MLKHVDLCSGIGGFALGFKWAGLSKPVLFCDIEPWCRKLLAQNFPNVPIADDVKEIANDPRRFIPEPIGILTAGYPCQPFSAAGKRRGEEDPRHIFPHILRIVAQTRPTFTVFENVYGHISMGLDNVLHAMEGEGYTVKPFIVPASGVGARHKRDRIWILGYAEHDGSSTSKIRGVNEEDARGASQGQIQTKQSSGASGREDDVNVADSEGIIQNGIRGEANQVSDRGNSRLELECGSYRQFSGEPEQNVADTSGQRLQGSKRLRENEKEVGERRESANG